MARTILIIAAIAGFFILGYAVTSGKFNQSWNWQKKYLTEGSFSYKIPRGWKEEKKNDKNFDIRVEYSPANAGQMPGTTGQAAVTVASQREDEPPMSTQREFDAWYVAEKGTDEIDKIGSLEIGGKRAVKLGYEMKSQNGELLWSLTTWIREGDTNIYINTLGNGIWNKDDMKFHQQFSESLVFD